MFNIVWARGWGEAAGDLGKRNYYELQNKTEAVKKFRKPFSDFLKLFIS